MATGSEMVAAKLFWAAGYHTAEYHIERLTPDRLRLSPDATIEPFGEPERAMEEERRLGYVAWTRARRTLTLSYDPAVPSRFLLEAFSPEELGLDADVADT